MEAGIRWTAGTPTAAVTAGIAVDRFSRTSDFFENQAIGRVISNEDIASSISDIFTLIVLAAAAIWVTYLVQEGAANGANAIGIR